MAIYYVSPYGSDSNNGLGPDASNSTNKPFLTLAKAIGSGGAAAAGDTVYIAPGVYRANTNVGVSGASGNPITVSGDTGNTQGFKDGSGNPLSAGEVRITNYTTNDKTAPSAADLLSFNNKSFFNVSNLWFVGYTPAFSGTNDGVVLITGGSHDISFTACAFSITTAISNGYVMVSLVNSTSQLALNVTFDRCMLLAVSCKIVSIVLAKTSSGSADYNANVLIQNSLFLGGDSHVYASSTGSGTYLGGGVVLKNNTFAYSGNNTIYVNDAGVSASYPGVTVQNNIVLRNGTALYANTSGQIVEDYNLLTGPRTNVTTGTHSTSDGSNALLLDFGQWMLWGQTPRAFLTPSNASPQLGFGNASGAPTYDWLNRNRPEGGLSLSSAIGYLERHDTAVQETVITDSGGVGLRIDGPGSHEFQIPVDATSTTISVKCYYDANHGATTPPQAILAAAPELGVVSQTVTAPATAGQWSTLTFSTITPTSRGVARVILVARPSAANGKAYFDTFAVS